MEYGTLKSANWTEYEHEFYNLCVSKKWFIQQDKEDGSTYLEPAREDKKGLYKVYSHGPGLCGIIIMADGDRPAALKNTILKKLIKAKVITGEVKKKGNSTYVDSPDILTDGDGEAIAIFKIDRLPRAVKTLNLRKAKKKTVVESREEELIAVRKLHAKMSREYLRDHYAFQSEKIISRLTERAANNGWNETNNYITDKDNLKELHEEDAEAYHNERLS